MYKSRLVRPIAKMRKIGIPYLLMLASFQVLALEKDRTAIAKLGADSADLNQQTHQGSYKGNVQFDQGTTHLRANEAITIGNEENKLTFAKALGTEKEPAHFWTQTDDNKPPLHAYALEIHYYAEKHLIVLIGNARVEQGEDSLAAPKITYDTEKKHVVTYGNKKLRTTIIFHSGKKT
ncbi:lipopolysaccharide transport periplasmic protein LptA [Legionella sp. D16C41]|uniref:lipopolysaccharide transport periplasmic protein LptA n=1 Tax=Legionella sp. D16C41 TaxID=3402688 RepID=UPI003AF5563A